MTKYGNNNKSLYTLIIILALLSLLIFLFRDRLQANGVDFYMVLTGNLLLFVLSFFTLKRSLNAINHPNPHVFVRSFYAGFLIRLAAVAVAAFLYIYLNEGKVSRASLFSFMGLYAVYSIVEVSALRKVLKEKSNA